MNSNTLSTPTQEEIEKFAEFVKDIRFAMLTTQAPDGSLRSRPMATLATPFDGDLWFFTDDDAPKVDEIVREHHVCVSYAEPEKQRYISVSGLATVVRDRARIQELWTPAAKAWFPRGIDDPHLAVLRVRTQRAEYWDAPSSKMVQLYGYAKAVFTGKRPENVGEHKTIDVTPPAERM
ncbi:general stress protein [Opitutaceae bacterium EW11]|nr:general stress protein [Opitutaceae bacterium EW11]